MHGTSLMKKETGWIFCLFWGRLEITWMDHKKFMHVLEGVFAIGGHFSWAMGNRWHCRSHTRCLEKKTGERRTKSRSVSLMGHAWKMKFCSTGQRIKKTSFSSEENKTFLNHEQETTSLSFGRMLSLSLSLSLQKTNVVTFRVEKENRIKSRTLQDVTDKIQLVPQVYISSSTKFFLPLCGLSCMDTMFPSTSTYSHTDEWICKS